MPVHCSGDNSEGSNMLKHNSSVGHLFALGSVTMAGAAALLGAAAGSYYSYRVSYFFFLKDDYFSKEDDIWYT